MAAEVCEYHQYVGGYHQYCRCISSVHWRESVASKHIYLLTQVRVSGSSTADVDLQLVPQN